MRQDAIGRAAEPARHGTGAGQLVESLLLQPHEQRHQLGRIERHRPLRDVLHVARVERQLGPAVLLPDAVAVAEARERAHVPVVDDARPGVAERLAVGGAERGRQIDRVAAVGRLRREAGASTDVIYLDPMFPERQKAAQVKKPMQLLQVLLEDAPDDGAGLLEAALHAARYRVVVKRPMRAPGLTERQPSHQIKGSNIRFDVYALRSMRQLVQAV